MLLAAIALGAARLLGNSGRTVTIVTGLGAYPLLFLLDQADPVRLAGIGAMYLLVAVRATRARH
jgi:hypothetical protein